MEPSNEEAAPQADAEQRCDIVATAMTSPESHSQTDFNSGFMALEASDESSEFIEHDSFFKEDEESSEYDSVGELYEYENYEEFKREQDIHSALRPYKAEYLPLRLCLFSLDASQIIRRRMSKAADDPLVDELPRKLRKMIKDRCSAEMIRLFQGALNKLTSMEADTETGRRIGAMLADLWWSKEVISELKDDWFDPEKIFANELRRINELATAQANSTVSENWGDCWWEKLDIDTPPAQNLAGGNNYRWIRSCRDLASASPNWDHARKLINYSAYSRIIQFANSENPGIDRELQVCGEDIEKAAEMAKSEKLPSSLGDLSSSPLQLGYNEHGVLSWKSEGSPKCQWFCNDDDQAPEEYRERLKEEYARMQNEGWIRESVEKKRKALPVVDAPAAQRPRNA